MSKGFITYLLICSIPFASLAQLFVSKSAAITTGSGVEITVNGDVQFDGTTAIANYGTISLSGDWTNNTGTNLFGTSAGTVNFFGAVQSVTGFTAFNHMTLSGAGTVTLQTDQLVGGAYASPAGVLSIGAKRLMLNSRLLQISNASPGAITRTTGFIVSETDPLAGYGRVEWQWGNPSAGTYTVPFGNDITYDYLPVSLTFSNGGLGTGSKFTFATYPTDVWQLPNNRPLPTGITGLNDATGSEMAQYVVDRFWIIEPQNYIIQPTANLLLTYRDLEANTGNNLISESTLQAQHTDGNIWSQPPAGITDGTANQTSILAVNDWDHIWALVSSGFFLPITLVDFTATAVDNTSVLCQWTTASELNNDYFTVERSRDMQYWEDVGKVPGAGNSQQTLHYLFSDDAPFHGISYYRLRQTDYNGETSLGPVRAVEIINEHSDFIQVWPNPSPGPLTVQINSALTAPVQLRISDLSGRIVQSYELNHQNELSKHLIDQSGLKNGVYLLHFIHGKHIQVVRWILSR